MAHIQLKSPDKMLYFKIPKDKNLNIKILVMRKKT